MPEYIYIDEAGHQKTINVRMFYGTAVLCDCGMVMHRKPQMPAINWCGLKPSAGELHPNIRQHIADRNKRLEAYQARKENESG